MPAVAGHTQDEAYKGGGGGSNVTIDKALRSFQEDGHVPDCMIWQKEQKKPELHRLVRQYDPATRQEVVHKESYTPRPFNRAPELGKSRQFVPEDERSKFYYKNKNLEGGVAESMIWWPTTQNVTTHTFEKPSGRNQPGKWSEGTTKSVHDSGEGDHKSPESSGPMQGGSKTDAHGSGADHHGSHAQHSHSPPPPPRDAGPRKGPPEMGELMNHTYMRENETRRASKQEVQKAKDAAARKAKRTIRDTRSNILRTEWITNTAPRDVLDSEEEEELARSPRRKNYTRNGRGAEDLRQINKSHARQNTYNRDNEENDRERSRPHSKHSSKDDGHRSHSKEDGHHSHDKHAPNNDGHHSHSKEDGHHSHSKEGGHHGKDEDSAGHNYDPKYFKEGGHGHHGDHHEGGHGHHGDHHEGGHASHGHNDHGHDGHHGDHHDHHEHHGDSHGDPHGDHHDHHGDHGHHEHSPDHGHHGKNEGHGNDGMIEKRYYGTPRQEVVVSDVRVNDIEGKTTTTYTTKPQPPAANRLPRSKHAVDGNSVAFSF